MSYRWRRFHATRYRIALKVRPAEHRDFEAVVAIDKEHAIYGGKDYLPKLYHEILRIPNCYCFVGEFRNKIVCFNAVHVMQGGNGVISCSGRTHASVQNLGIYTVFRDLVFDIIEDHFPDLQWSRFQGNLPEHLLNAAESPDHKYRILQTWNFVSVCVSESILRSIVDGLEVLNRTYDRNVKYLTFNEAKVVLGSEDICQVLVPKGVLFTGPQWMPTILPVQNVKKLYQENQIYGVYQGPHTRPCAIGVTSSYATATNVANTHIFYHGEASMDTLMIFLRTVFLGLLRRCPPNNETFTFCCHFPPDINAEDLERRLPGVLQLHRTRSAYMEHRRFKKILMSD